MLKYVLMFIIYFLSNDLVGQKIIHTEWENDDEFHEYTMRGMKTDQGNSYIISQIRVFYRKKESHPLVHDRTYKYKLYDNGVTVRNRVEYYDENGKIGYIEESLRGENCEYLLKKTYRGDNSTVMDTLTESSYYPDNLSWENCYKD